MWGVFFFGKYASDLEEEAEILYFLLFGGRIGLSLGGIWQTFG